MRETKSEMCRGSSPRAEVDLQVAESPTVERCVVKFSRREMPTIERQAEKERESERAEREEGRIRRKRTNQLT